MYSIPVVPNAVARGPSPNHGIRRDFG
jgi:hypothetical protein